MNSREHWEDIYQTKEREEMSWFCEHLDTSFRMITSTGFGRDAAIIDVGGGNSTLVDDLLRHGFVDVSVLDISGKAIADSQDRLGPGAATVNWIEGDITAVRLPALRYDIWHDRAVFHFLTDNTDRELYLMNLRRALKPGGQFILGTFAEDGPLKCSGIDVERYSLAKMTATLGPAFALIDSSRDEHQTPFGTTQCFQYGRFLYRTGAEATS